MRIKICQIIPTLVQGGAEKQLTLLAKHLDPNKFECHVVVLTHTGPLEKELRDCGIKVHVIGKRFKLDPSTYFRLQKCLRSISPQVVHTWLFAANSYGRWAAESCRVPVIIAGERCVDPWKAWWNYAVDKLALKHTSCIATNTTAVAEFYAGHGIPQNLFQVIPNAIQPPVRSITKTELFERLGIPPRKFVIGAVGRLWPQKGYPDLIWASELVRIVVKDLWIVIIGDGPQRQRLMELRDQYGSQDALKFVGHRKDASELLTAFDMLWNGSLYEGQSNTILEAMVAGLPVVATDIPGNRDLVVDSVTGYLYPVGDVGKLSKHSIELLMDCNLRQRMSEQANLRATSQFSLERMVLGYEKLYTDLFEQSLASPDGIVRYRP